jgi:hypothetical protein
MKCHAGVEFPSGAPCPKCKAGLGEVCWPGINNDLAELVQLKAAVREFIDAEAAVEAEAKRAEANGGKGWSSAPVVRRLYAVAGLAKFAPALPNGD